ncbi:uncharacterized protein C16orf86-like [Ochotona curzoniae]|uniref:uncharacterized protein C16orf86-like n=1 Tax=Ochotona curzoniae TaxID=130825 RepID=UPI001B34BCC3|nr:uncharacterized protein C16orf86-like [Ochotona curzoniae]
MTSAGRPPEAQEEVAVEPAQLTLASSNLYECPVLEAQSLVPAPEVFRTTGEDNCPRGPASEPETQEQEPKLEVEVPEERGPRLIVTPVRPGHGPKRKVEVELSPGLSLQREESEGSQSEPSPSPKQHKKAKKRKSLGASGLLASAAPAPSEVLGPERKAQRLRPLYQYINYCNPELNQASEEDVETKAEVKTKAEAEPDSEPGLVPEEAGVEPLQALLPATAAAELGSGLAMPCISVLLTPMHVLPPGEEPGGSPDADLSDCLKTEVDKAAEADVDKMLSVCTAPLVPPLSPQYK